MLKILEQLLEAEKISKDVADTLDADLSKSFKELRDENAAARVKLKSMQTELDGYAQTKEEFEAYKKDLEVQILEAEKKGEAKIVVELEKYKKTANEFAEALKQQEAQNKELTIKTALSDALGGFDTVDSEIVASALKNYVQLEDNQVMMKYGDGLYPLKDGVAKFFEDKPTLLKPVGNAGGGANTQQNSGSLDLKTATDEQMADYIAKHGVDALAKMK